jgi:ornithine cyclodeaminase/alanine dehydrogenase-like protein (mu-crystallin family)
MAETEKRKLILINKAALDELVSLQDAIAIVDSAMREYSAGQVGSPQRAVLSVNPATKMGLMPGTMPGLGRFGLKVVSLSSDAAVRRRHGPAALHGGMPRFDTFAHGSGQRGGDAGIVARRQQGAHHHRQW